MKMWLVFTLVFMAASYIFPGIHVASFWTALIAVIVLALVNIFIKPFVFLLTLPINILTIGLFTLVINALMIILVTYIVPGFTVDGFWWALLLSLLLTGTRILFGTDK